MVTQAPKRTAVLAALAFTLSCVGLIVFVWTQFGGTIPFAAEGYRVSALFQQAGELVPGADVRISGVNVGKVASVSNRGLESRVTIEIEPQFAPLPTDTRAVLREKTLLGEGYVALSTGQRTGTMFADGATIPVTHVQPTQSLDQVLATFDKPTQQAFENFLNGSATALAGRGQALSNAIGNLNPAVTELTAMAGELNQEQPSLEGVIANGATVLGTLGDRAAALRTLISAGDQVFGATAARNRALSAAVDGLPPFLARLRTTLVTLGFTLQDAKPSLDALRPVAPLVSPALHALIGLSGPALSVLRAAPAVISAADRSLPATARFTDAYRRASNVLLPAAQELVGVISLISQYRTELVTSMANLAAGLQARAKANTPSGQASYIRAVSVIGNESVFGQSIRSPTNRHNAYFSPGELANLASGGLLSSDCANTGNVAEVPAGGHNLPCRVQPAFNWGNGVAPGYFPHLTRAPG